MVLSDNRRNQIKKLYFFLVCIVKLFLNKPTFQKVIFSIQLGFQRTIYSVDIYLFKVTIEILEKGVKFVQS